MSKKKKRPPSPATPPPAPGDAAAPSPSSAPGSSSSGRTMMFVAVGAAALVTAIWYFTRPPEYTTVPTPTQPTVKAPLPTGPIMEDEATAFAGYAGDAACKSCHAGEFGKWSTSNHGLAERAFRDDLDKAAFEPAKTFSHGTQQTTAQMANGMAQIVALGFDNQTKPFTIERVIGHDPLRQFLVQGERGMLHTLEACWDPHKNEWFNVYGNEDRKPGEWGHWTGRGMVWNAMCASCHNTRVRKNYDSATDTYRTTMAHMTVSCESCHGPMKAHADAYLAGNPAAYAKRTLSRDQMMDACAMCHARRTELTGDFKPGDAFFNHHSLAIVDQTDLFYPDGQIRDEDYEFTSFLSSRMHHAGVRCVDCHDPHTAKRLLPGNDLCMRCHTAGGYPNAPVIVPTAHTFHGAESTGSQCVNCHMPQTVYMQRHSRHDHGFTIPDPLMTKQFGIPNACNKCHTDKDTDWSLAAVEKWFGDKMNRRTRQRATVMAKARRGDEEAREGLLGVLASDDTPYWKASACLMLDRWSGNDEVRSALLGQLSHEHPLVRGSAVQALGPLAEMNAGDVRVRLQPLLEDPVRNVRVAAAWALRNDVSLGSLAGKELQHMLSHNADMPSGLMQLGQFHYARNNAPEALKQMQRAVQMDPNSPPFRRDLAMMHSVLGDAQGSIAELKEAIRLNPNEAQYHYELGLAWNEAGDMAQAIASLREAVKRESHLSRAWYNLGLALNQQGRAQEALDVLAQGASANPTDPALSYVRATILANAGRLDEARNEVFRVLKIQPNHPEALQLREALNRGGPQ